MNRNRLRSVTLLSIFLMILLIVAGSLPQGATADHTPGPASVAIAGDLQSELGCPGDWQPECAATELGYDAEDDVWQATFNVPAGSWNYKAALNDSWDENYGANAVPSGGDIPLSLDAPTDVKFYYDHKSHWVTDNVNSIIATAAGTFQSELGCGGDWDPSCLRSWLQDADGDGVYVFRSDEIPAQDYEFKVALNEAWDDSFPANNVPFTVDALGDLVIITYDGATNEVTVEVLSASIEPGDELLVQSPVRMAAQDNIFYFVMPDRFENGDPSNDAGGDLSGDPLVNGFLPTDKGFYHGGDLAGLAAQLPYLDGLGVNAIWLTPQFKNTWVQGDGTIAGSSAGYHGYWQIDYSQIDPHFGSNAEMHDFINAAHALGMQVFFDIVANHTGDVISYQEGEYIYINKSDFPYRTADNVPFDDRDYAGTGTFPPLDPAISFPYTPFVAAGDENLKSPAWLNDPIYYHNRGDSTFAGESSLYGDFYGLDDLFTEHPVVQDGLIQIYKDMITTYDIDGFRIDTVKHVNDELWEAFGPAITAHADAEGKPNFFFFGEVFDSNPAFTSRFTTELPLQAVLDFGFQSAARGFASGGGATNALRDFYASDDLYTDSDSNAYALPTFLGNHDMGRIGAFLQGDNAGASDAELLARDQLAHALMYLGRGTPVVYYGDEQGFTGAGGDKDARQDMMPSLVADYNDDVLIGTSATTADDNFDTSHPLYQTLQDLAALRTGQVALRQGAQLHRYSEGGAGIYAFSRIERGEKIETIVALNNSEVVDSATFHTDSPSTSFTELWPGDGSAISSDANGDVTVEVPALGVKVYRADAPIPDSTSATWIGINTPAEGEEVLGRIEIGATVGSDRFAEVTFAVSVAGGEYEPIGTDDNAPYRIFYDVSEIPPGTPLTFKAIYNDLNGHYSSDKVNVVVGTEAPPTVSGFDYAVIHYNRPAGDYGDPTIEPFDFNNYWGLHLWGDGIDPSEVTDWTIPKPFEGEDEFGRFAWIKRGDGSVVNFIIHKGDTKDTDPDRSFDADVNPEIWVNEGDETIYTSQAAAQGYVTIHYHRDDGDYASWGLHLWGDAIDPSEGTSWDAPKPPTGSDDYGLYWEVLIQDDSQPVNFIIHRGDEKDPGPDESFIPAQIPTVWKQSGDVEIYPSRGAAENFATIHYHRDDGDYGDPTSDNFNDFWGLHVWAGAVSPTDWADPLRWSELDVFGPVFEVDVIEGAPELAYIIHRGDTKDPGPDQFLSFDPWGYEVWQLEGEGPNAPEPHYVLPILGEGAAPGDISVQQAHWVAADTIVWDAGGDPSADYRLYFAPDGGMTLGAVDIEGGSYIELGHGAPFPQGIDGYLHLAGKPTLKIDPADLPLVPEILKGQIAIQVTKNGARVDATGLQIPGVLDDLYAYEGELGVSWKGGIPTIRVWAPTAKSVTFHLFDDSDEATSGTSLPMTLDAATGVWSIVGNGSWKNKFYLYEVEVYVHATGQVEHNLVTDPYSLSLSMNSKRSQIVDLDHATLKPQGWDKLEKPPLAAPEDISIYEIHVRDFSVNDDTVPEDLKGTYKAFTLEGTNGTKHLQALQEAGLTHLHLLPVFDIATIDEDKSTWQMPDWDVLESYPPDSEEQQAAVAATNDLDAFNWGYDPFHYTTPEGSYATDPDGSTRIVEFREMVQSLNEDSGLRVVMDVVYNHTNSSGQEEKSVLDKVVPGYYHRLNDQGQVETSTCCQNTATEHKMMEKLMVDSLVTWAKAYKIDAFRFDLMGHHSLANMMAIRAALDALTLEEDGVDGSAIYLYGEGWNFGEVANDARFIQATQLNLGGSGIGSFSDRLRDAVRGGGPFDSGQDLIRRQGFANGLFYDPNALNGAPEPAPEPTSVTIAGDLQFELGCPGDWQPECAATHLTYDVDDTVWQGNFTVPVGDWKYKAALNDSWDENYGANATPGGADIPLNLGAETQVKFYYSHATHWVTDNENAVIATVPGDFQDEIGCPGEWQPDCLRSWLQDPDGDGTYTFATSAIPPGDYNAKVAIDESWAENYGAGGVQNGDDIPFTVEAGQRVIFSYDAVSHILTISYEASDQLAELLHLTDQIRVGMAGNLADYEFIDSNGDLVTGADIDYNGQPAGYTQDPQEDITYISKHDNQTLYDNNTYKNPLDTSMTDRVRVQNVGLSTVLLGQGVPFTHAGSDLLRSKSFDRDSYNSGDWFNKLDFSYQINNYGVGLPVVAVNQDNWPIMQPRLADPALNPAPEDIMFSAALFQELLAIRDSSPLFRLQTEADVQARVMFHNTGPAQLPGLIVMSISDEGTALDLDPTYEGIVVLINANDEAQTFTDSGFSDKFIHLHPVQMDSVDDAVKTSTFDPETGTFTVPGRTAAVFVHESPEELIGNLIDQVQDLEDQGVLNHGRATALIAKLEQALARLANDKPKQAIREVENFIKLVENLSPRVIPAETAAELIEQAETIIEAIQIEY